MDEVFTGPTAVAFSNEDVVAPAKIMDEFAKEAKALEIKGGIIEGKVSSLEEITALAKLPNREGLLSMLLSYYKRQSATWLTLSKQWQKRRWRCSLIAA